MFVGKIQLKNFRNYDQIELNFNQGVHIFSGFNAQGKTNLLEAIFMSVLGNSFRAGHDDELISWGAANSSIEIFFNNRIAVHNLLFKLHRGEGRENILNGQKVKKQEIIGLINRPGF